MYTITDRLDITPGGYPTRINLSQYDNAFTIVLNLFSSVGEFAIGSGATAALVGTKADGNGYSAVASISDKSVTITGDKQLTAAVGESIFEIVIYDDDKEIRTSNFIIHVERAALDKDTIVSDSKIRELVNVIDKTDDLLAAANSVESTLTDMRTIKAQIETLKGEIQTIYDNTTSAASTAATDAASAAVEDVQSDIQTMVDTAVESAFPSINGKTMTGDHNGAYYDLVDSVGGKGLSENDYTNADKAVVTRLNDDSKTLSTNDYTNADKAVVERLNDPSKGLSTNDYTDADKQKLDDLDVPNPSAIVALLDILKSKQILTNDTYDLIKDML